MLKQPVITRVFENSLTPNLKEEIDRFVSVHNGTVFHETQFNLIASEAFETELSYFVARTGGEMVGICPCQSIRKGLVISSFSNLSSFEIPYGGWIYDSKKTNIQYLFLLTPIKINEALHITSNPELADLNSYTISDASVKTSKTLLLKTSGTTSDELLDKMNHKQRNKIKRAYKIGIKTEVINPDDFHIFWDLFASLKSRVNMPLRERQFYEQIYKHYYTHHSAVCLAADFEGSFISALILLANANFTVAWIAGRQDNLPNNLYQNELLLWEGIKWAVSSGSSYFDFCGLDEEKLPHLARIKLCFTREIVPFYHYNKKKLIFKILNRL